MNCSTEIQGIKTIALYVNKEVRFRRPNPSIENEIDLIAHSAGSVVVYENIEHPRWERKIDYSGNYRQVYSDIFSFFLHGINNNTPEILKLLRANRNGYIAEIITKANNSFVFPTPIFVSKIYEKDANSHSWAVEMSYRKPTFEDKLIKLSTLLMTSSFIAVGSNSILGSGNKFAITSN